MTNVSETSHMHVIKFNTDNTDLKKITNKNKKHSADKKAGPVPEAPVAPRFAV